VRLQPEQAGEEHRPPQTDLAVPATRAEYVYPAFLAVVALVVLRVNPAEAKGRNRAVGRDGNQVALLHVIGAGKPVLVAFDIDRVEVVMVNERLVEALDPLLDV